MNKSLKTLEQVLNELDGKGSKLLIPSYQRGYRWSPTEVTQLLDDINGEQFGNHYFLQLLAVRDTGASLRIIDGQQRLTTALLILDCIDGGSRIRDIVYETRGESLLDKHFMEVAANAIKCWLKVKSATHKKQFVQKLKDCEFLYFPVEDETVEFDFFSRLNTWKIPATDSELVKCFFLSTDDAAKIERSIKWNQMERQISDNRFWGMFTNHENVKKDRMGVLLSYAIESGHRAAANDGVLERFPLFEAFKRAEKAGTPREVLWARIETTFSFLQKWYGDRSARHLVGWFFHCTGRTVSEAKAVVKIDEDTICNAMKTACYLCGDGKWLEDANLYETLSGEEKKKWLVDYLLLANAAWCSERCGVDYDFFRHSLVERWSIEHVHARNQRKLSAVEFKSLKFKDQGNLSALWDEYAKIETQDAANAFLQEKLSEESGYPHEDEDNSLGNLALLPGDANSSLNDKLFRGKQREILSWALQQGDACYWAPPLTVAMFVKEIGCDDDKFKNYWTDKDRDAYSDTMKSLVDEFIKRFNVQ